MADPKGGKKDNPKPPAGNLLEELIFWLFFLLIISAVFARAVYIYNNLDQSTGFVASLRDYYYHSFLPTAYLVAIFLSVLFALGIGWCVAKLTAVNKELNLLYIPPIAVEPGSEGAENSETKRKWHRVLSHLNSQNPNDWKFAILEADIMLDNLLESLAYPGPTMADRLKSVHSGDFKTLDLAWEAHKIRNVIAHEGADYVLSEREARRVIELYASVFKEFKII